MENNLRKSEWKKHVENAKRHPSGVRAYCQEQGIGNSRFYYWNKKLKGEKPLVAKESIFAAVEVIQHKSVPALPDPRWLAEFLRAYTAGSRQ
jgi:hypothetical protein